MIPFAEFELSPSQIERIKQANKRNGIREYLRDNNAEPDSATAESFYTISEEDIEKYRRIYYSLLICGNYHYHYDDDSPHQGDDEPIIDSGGTVDSGATIDSGSTEDSGSTIESGSTIDSGSTEESETTRPSSQFVLSLAEIPCAVGDGDWSRYAIDTIREGIMSGDLLDYTSAEITMSGGNGSLITITDLTKPYYIPDGEYTAEGWIGRSGSRGFHDWGWPQYEKGFALAYGQFVIDGSKKTIPLTIEINDAIVVSDKVFYGKTGGSPKTAYGYKNNYYFFIRNDYHQMGLSTPYITSAIPMTFLFDGIEYKIDSFNMGAAYCYGWNNEIPQDYSGSTPSFDYDEFVRLTYNVTDIYNPTKLFYSSASTEGIGYMEIDGQSVIPTDEYLFATLGTHKVNVLLKNSSTMTPLKFTNVPALRGIVIPSSIDSLGRKGLFFQCSGIETITCLSLVPPDFCAQRSTIQEEYDFSYMNQNGIVYVPYGAKQQYTTAWAAQSSSNYKTLQSVHWTIEELPQSED